MAVVLLKDKLKTRFMIDSIVTLMENVMKEIVKRGDVVDIAHVNFTPYCMRKFLTLLSSFPEGSIIDSYSIDRNNILEENFKRVKAVKNVTYVDITSKRNKPRSVSDVVEKINALEKDKVYKIIAKETLDFDIPYVTYIQLMRPSIQIDLGAYAWKFYQYVSDVLYSKNRQKVIDSTDDYIMFIKGKDELSYSTMRVTITEKDSNKPFYVYPVGEISWTKILDTLGDVYLIPYAFGREKVLADPKLKELYWGLRLRCIEDIERYAKVNWKTLKSILLK